jgi:putative drug exporter of the RND superfamily
MRRDRRSTNARAGGAGRRGTGVTERIARAAALHPWRTIALYALLMVAAVLSVGGLLSSGITSDMQQHGKQPDSAIGTHLMEQRLTGPARMTDFVIVRSAARRTTDAAFRAYVAGLAGKIRGLGRHTVQTVSTPYQTGDPSMVSRDGHAALIAVVMAGDTDQALKDVAPLHGLVLRSGAPGFTLSQTGDASLNKMADDLAKSDLERAEVFGMPVALIVLVLVFGAVLAAVMPLVLSICSILLAVTLTGLIGQLYPMNTFVLNILTMMGLAVGIDYTLFIISRYREERARGLEKIDAIAATGATANRAIFFSGMTVVLAMLGMVIVPVDITISLGVGVMLVVVTTLFTSLVLLPAVLGLLGDRVNALRVPILGRRIGRTRSRRGPWEKLATSIMRRPVIWLVAAVTLLLLAASPIVFLQTGSNSASAAGFPQREWAKQGWDVLGRDFSLGKADPVQIVVDGKAGERAVKHGIARLQSALRRDRRFGPAQVATDKAGDLTVLTVPLAGDPAAGATQDVIRHLRSDVVPRAFAGAPAHVFITGATANVVDYLDFFHHWMPIALAVVLSLSFVLLLLAFRSVVIPAKAILMNLLSVGAAYGLLVLVFQKGVGAHLLGLQRVASIEAWVPLMLFSLLFGLSMDYQVFLISRIKERFDHTGDTREAVAFGVGRTAGIITGAAAIMVCVFAGMAGGDLVMFQQMGFGLAVAIFIDATVVRTIIVPAALELLGDWNWYLPRWLEWLPDVSVEGRVAARDGREPAGERKPAPAPRPMPVWRAPGASATVKRVQGD